MKNLLILTLLLGSLTTFSQTLSLDDGETYAVVVGISDYQDEQIPDLRFADKDALAFAGFLQSPAGGELDVDHLKVLINDQATVAQFAIALDWLWEVVKENDKVIIYFSGHGDVERKSLTQPGFLLCWDAPSKVYMAGGTFALPMLQEVISTLSVQNKAKVIVITDACRSGKLSGSSVGGSQLTSNNLARQYANEIKILSCQPNEYSIEGEQWGGGRGAFSYHLLDGLYGMADDNNDLSVNLMEIGRYLEDHVSKEVAPQSQIPMTVGGRGEELTTIFPEILEQLKEGRKGQMQLFSPTESKGIEEDVIAQADSNIIEMYLAFKQSLKNKQFLKPENACADFYYEKLSQESQLEKLHSTMRRNYAAALQDDAQQVLNNLIRSALNEYVTANIPLGPKYRYYPKYLSRAAELLGDQHYMYPILQARKLYFQGFLKLHKQESPILYKEALKWQPDMPQAYYGIMKYQDSMDSVLYYAEKALAYAPNWILPYTRVAEKYRNIEKNNIKSKEWLEKAQQIDSTSAIVYKNWAGHYGAQKNTKKREEMLLKAISVLDSGICLPCTHNSLGAIYQNKYKRPDLAEYQFLKAIEGDPTNHIFYFNLGNVYNYRKEREKAKHYYQKAIEVAKDDNNPRYEYMRTKVQVPAHVMLGNIYLNEGKLVEAAHHAEKALVVKGRRKFAERLTKILLADIYLQSGKLDSAENHLMRHYQKDSTSRLINYKLGELHLKKNNVELAKKFYLQASKLKTDKDLFQMGKSPLFHLATLYAQENEIALAFDFLRQALDDSSDKRFYAKLTLDFLEGAEELKSLKEEKVLWKELMQKYFPDENKK